MAIYSGPFGHIALPEIDEQRRPVEPWRDVRVRRQSWSRWQERSR